MSPRRTESANLLHHGGKAPRWSFERMVRLVRAIVSHTVGERSPEELLRRLSDPHRFQALGCVLGFDRHSSGATTTTCGALKEAVRGAEGDFGSRSRAARGGPRGARRPRSSPRARRRVMTATRSSAPAGSRRRSTRPRSNSLARRAGRELRHRAACRRCRSAPRGGAETLRALALVAELVYGTPASTRDPARFAFAHDGKDGMPFAADRATYDRTIETMERALNGSRIDRSERVAAVKRLSRFARAAA